MSFLERHALRLTLRDLRRTAAIGLGIAIAAALITSVILFGGASGSTVTRRVLAGLPVDAQVLLAPAADAAAVAQSLAADPAVVATMPFELVAFDSARLDKAGTATQTSIGAIVAVDQAYTQMTGLFGVIQGAAQPGQMAISRDLATNLGAVPGDTIVLTLPGGAVANLTVSGIVDTTGADLILGPIDQAHRSAGANPPTNVALTDRVTLDALAAQIPAGAVPAAPPQAAGTTSGPVASTEPAVRRELHLRYDHTQLPGDPVTAQSWLDTVRHRIELGGVGAITVVDDAAASLEPLAGDLLWGQILFVFLAPRGLGGSVRREARCR